MKKGFREVELRSYWAIIWRHIWIVALVVGVVILYMAYEANHLRTTQGALKGYKSEVTVRFGFQAATGGSNQNINDAVTASEALADAFTTGPVLTSREFMAQIVQQVRSDTDQITQKFGTSPDLGSLRDTDAMSKSLSSAHTHNLVTITVNWGTTAGSWAIANAISEITTAHLNQYLGYAITSTDAAKHSSQAAQAAAQQVSAPTDPQATTGTAFARAILLVLLLLAALIIGIALAFLIEYLGDRIRNQDDVVQLLQLPSYGAVPRAPTSGVARPPTKV